MRQVSPAATAMASGSGIDPDDDLQEPVNEERDNSNAATAPSDSDGEGAPSAVAAESGADAPSPPSPPPAAPVDTPQERVLQQAGSGTIATTSPSDGDGAPPPSAVAAEGGGDAPSPPSPPPAAPVDTPQERARQQAGSGTNGSSSAATGAVDHKGKKPACASPSPPRSPGRSPSTSSSSDSDWLAGTDNIDSKQVFQKLVRQGEKKKPEREQVRSSHPKKGFWRKCKSLFSRKEKIDGEGRKIYRERPHVNHQTLPITEVHYRYRATEDMPILLNLDAFSRIRPVLGDGECFYRSFIFSYLEQVLDRQDTHEEQRFLDTAKRVSTEHENLGWEPLEFRTSYKAFKKLIKKIMEWKRQGTSNNIASISSYSKEKLLEFFSTYVTTNDIFVFLRLVVAIHICSHSDQYGDLIRGIYGFNSLKDWCFQVVTQPREFTDHLMMRALATAVGVPLRLERLYGGGSEEDNIYSGPGAVSVTLLYTGNHYDIIYPIAPSAESPSRQASQGEDPAG